MNFSPTELLHRRDERALAPSQSAAAVEVIRRTIASDCNGNVDIRGRRAKHRVDVEEGGLADRRATHARRARDGHLNGGRLLAAATATATVATAAVSAAFGRAKGRDRGR